MFQGVTMKEVAIATIEVDKEKTNMTIQALENAIEQMNKEYPQEKQLQICALMDLLSNYYSIRACFRE